MAVDVVIWGGREREVYSTFNLYFACEQWITTPHIGPILVINFRAQYKMNFHYAQNVLMKYIHRWSLTNIVSHSVD